MGICWYCYWGWPKKVYDIYAKAVDDLDCNTSSLHFGPSHIVWDDENFDSAEWCLEHFNEYKNGYSNEELEIVKHSLEELAKLPLKERCVEPEDYDDEHPELYPPPKDMVMIKL
jgi:hypothetical protein